MTGSAALAGIAAAAASFLLTAGGAFAQGQAPKPAPVPPPPARLYVSDAPLAKVFDSVCLKAFPSASAVETAVKTQSEAPLTPEQAKAYLPDGPGRGWLVRTSRSLFAVTLEDAPNRTCAVQEMTPDGVTGVGGLVDELKTYVKAMKGKLVAVAPKSAKTQDGEDVRYFGYGVLTSDDMPLEQFGVYVTDHHGQVQEPWKPYAGQGSGVDVRYTRTILAG